MISLRKKDLVEILIKSINFNFKKSKYMNNIKI